MKPCFTFRLGNVEKFWENKTSLGNFCLWQRWQNLSDYERKVIWNLCSPLKRLTLPSFVIFANRKVMATSKAVWEHVLHENCLSILVLSNNRIYIYVTLITSHESFDVFSFSSAPRAQVSATQIRLWRNEQQRHPMQGNLKLEEKTQYHQEYKKSNSGFHITRREVANHLIFSQHPLCQQFRIRSLWKWMFCRYHQVWIWLCASFRCEIWKVPMTLC